MTNREARWELMKFFSNEFHCRPEDFLSDNNLVVYGDDEPDVALRMICFGSAAVAVADGRMLKWTKELVSKHKGFRCFDGVQASLLANELIKHGFRVGCGQGAVLDMNARPKDIADCGYAIRVFEGADIDKLWANDLRAEDWHMVERIEDTRVMVAAYDADVVVGLACADRNTDMLYDIGYEVSPEYRAKGIATALTMELTRNLSGKGIIPFAKYAWSNIASSRVLHNCGYYAAWSRMGSARGEWVERIIRGEAE